MDLDIRKVGAIFFIIIGIVVILIGLKYGLFLVADVKSSISASIIGALFLSGVYLFKSNNKDNQKQYKIKKSKFPFFGKPKFEAKIKDNKIEYDRKRDEIDFILSYKGKIRQGFIACEIIPPLNFYPSIPNVDEDGHLSVFSGDTVTQINKNLTIKNIKRDIANLGKGNYKIDKLEWSWKIPEFVSKGDYTVTIGIWEFVDRKETPELLHKVENSFTILDDDDSHYFQNISL